LIEVSAKRVGVFDLGFVMESGWFIVVALVLVACSFTL
jgi:hypothetical protein